VYLVITQPFGMHPNPAVRGTLDVDRLASWISWVYRRDSIVETVYAMSTKDEVIVKIAEGVNPAVLLGRHKYSNILSAGWPWDPSPASCVFEYNYQGNGDPCDHNWREYIASDLDETPHLFRNPYPVPTWTVRPSYISGLVLTLPGSLPRTPSPSPEPPSGASRHIQREDVKQEPSYSSSKVPSGSGSVKVEPSRQTGSSITPGESPAYEPAQALSDQIALLNAGRSQASVRVKQEPFTPIGHAFGDSDSTRVRNETYDASEIGIRHSNAPPMGVKQESRDVRSLASVAGPPQTLWDEWARYQSNQKERSVTAGSMNQESYTPRSTAQPPTGQSSRTATFNSNLREPLPSFKTKREPAADEDVQPWKRPKTEIK